MFKSRLLLVVPLLGVLACNKLIPLDEQSEADAIADARTDGDSSVDSTDAPELAEVDSTCVPVCGRAQCGDDGCGGSCGECPPSGTCEEGICVEVSPSECLTTLECFLNCDRRNCDRECLAGASDTAQQLLGQLQSCGLQACDEDVLESGVTDCLSQSCTKEVTLCLEN